MGGLLALVPLILQMVNSPVVAQLLQGLSTIGQTSFPNVAPAQAAQAATSLFDTEHVMWVQTALILLGSTLNSDGVLGDTSKAAVIKFQSANKLPADGWPGPQTCAALRAALLAMKPAPAPAPVKAS